jgi:D-alanyl-D-alanine carboxypeptidase
LAIVRAIGVVLLFLAATGFGPPGFVPSSSAQDPFYASQVPKVQRLQPPQIGASGAAVVDAATGKLLFGKDQRRRLPMASTTKVMTALVALERGQPGQIVRVDVNAADLPGSSVMGLKAGERLSLLDLLYGMLLPSGNDAAIAVARAVAGSEDAFVSLMNQRAAQLGLADTHFANVHGLDAPNHYTSAADLAEITRVALRNPTFAQIVATQDKTVQGNATYRLQNTNPLLGRPDVEGVKTGHTDLAGACLVAGFRRDGHLVVTVVLNSPDSSAESLAIADYAFSAYAWPETALLDSPFDRAPDGSPWVLLRGLAAPVVPAWQTPYLRSDVDAGAGVVRLTLAGAVVGSAPIAAATPTPSSP